MFKRLIPVGFALCYCLSLSLPGHAAELNGGGEWSLTLQQGVTGMPGGIASLRWQECLGQDSPIPKDYLQASNCQVLEQHIFYHTLRYKMSCFGKHGTFINVGKLRFDDSKLSGETKSNIGKVDGIAVVVRYRIKGVRIGECE